MKITISRLLVVAVLAASVAVPLLMRPDHEYIGVGVRQLAAVAAGPSDFSDIPQ